MLVHFWQSSVLRLAVFSTQTPSRLGANKSVWFGQQKIPRHWSSWSNRQTVSGHVLFCANAIMYVVYCMVSNAINTLVITLKPIRFNPTPYNSYPTQEPRPNLDFKTSAFHNYLVWIFIVSGASEQEIANKQPYWLNCASTK